MKAFLVVLFAIWLICGFAGAWMLEGTNMHWKTIARGPLSLVEGYQDAPVRYPGEPG